MATEATEKAEVLRHECFPPPLQVDLADTENCWYPPGLLIEDGVTQNELTGIVWWLKSDKASEPDGITNRIVKLVVEAPGTELTGFFTRCLDLGHHPRAFRTATTVALRKPGKADYSDPSAYRPIALLNTLGKALEAIVATRISRLAEKHSLLPDTQYGARPRRSIDDALINVQEQIRAIWTRNPKVVV